MKKLKKFNVLEYNWNRFDKSTYDVLPYFRNSWKNKKFNFEKEKVKDKKTLKVWIERASRYMFWARCEYEFLMAPWPYREIKLKHYLKKDNYDYNEKHNFKMVVDDNVVYEDTMIPSDAIPDTIIMEDLKKIDVHEQIMMNIDIITDILFEEFKLEKK